MLYIYLKKTYPRVMFYVTFTVGQLYCIHLSCFLTVNLYKHAHAPHYNIGLPGPVCTFCLHIQKQESHSLTFMRYCKCRVKMKRPLEIIIDSGNL